MADSVQQIIEYPQEFIHDGVNFINKCSKPSKKVYNKRLEYLKIIQTVGTGFIVMGAIGYIVKLIHIPIRHLITV
ncbi:hypothetical protein V1514DRAFT_74800 [Lipomyces japonicus]|uniref:uncharacterized protein n=1 Tax=Lipomyces japonicus TaxID=56871 RepID=UPI0034CF76CA